MKKTLLLLLTTCLGCAKGPEPAQPNVLLILVDTLRPDMMGTYGGDPAVSPTLDSLAQQGAVFDPLISQAPWTRPAVGALLTSRYPSELGMDHGGLNGVMQALPESAPYLPVVMAAAGYSVAAVQSNPHLKIWTYFNRGFELYDYIAESRRTEFRARATTVLDSLAREERPFFLYLHLMEPHLPYLNHPDLPEPAPAPPADVGFRPRIIRRQLLTSPGLGEQTQRWIRHVYQRDIRFADAWLAQLLSTLRASGQAENTLILMVSDHGEELWEHGGAEHGHTLHDELLRVPGILVLPARGGGTVLAEARQALRERADPTVRGPARLVDLAPTVLDLLELPDLPDAQGQSLRSGLLTGIAPTMPPSLAEALLYGNQQRALMDGRWKLVRDLETGEHSLFDTAADPGEQQDLAAACEPELLATLSARLDSLVAACEILKNHLVPVDEATRRQLESLGYLGG